MTDRIEMSACTSVMVGKKASLDGATYISRNEDRLVAIHPKRFLVQPAVSGRQEIYKSPYNGLTVPLPESGYRYTSTPNADESEGPNEEDGFNEKNVGESATESVYANERVLAYDPFVKNGLAEDSMTTLVLPFINSARDGVRYLGELVKKYGSADLYSSNNTRLDDSKAFDALHPEQRNVYFGVREFGMATAVNGINLHGNTRAFGSTFFVFSDYLKAAIRLAAIQQIPAVYIFTHDSIAVGEDGPTHEPIEQLAGLRSIPNVTVIRPADAHEVLGAWQKIGQITDQPTVLVLTRQKVPLLVQTQADKVAFGGYTLSPAVTANPDGILVATGSEVALALQAQQKLAQEKLNVAVVSMPSVELFQAQSPDYQAQVLPPNVKVKLGLEMGSRNGLATVASAVIGIDHFGASGNGTEVVQQTGFTVDNIVEQFKAKLAEAEVK